MLNSFVKKDIQKRLKEYEKHFRELKYTGKIEGIAKKQQPKKLIVGSPFEVYALKDKRELPGTTFAVSWDKDDEVAIASIYYAVSHFKDIELFAVGDKKTRQEILSQLKKLSLLPKKFEEKDPEYTAEKKNIRGIVLSCSDSRVLDNAMFNGDQSDILIINNAGNVASSTVSSAIRHYLSADTEFIAVMAHSNCGAVNAACLSTDDEKLYPIIFKIKTGITQPVKNADEIKDSHYIHNANNTLKEILSLLGKNKVDFYVAYHNLFTGSTDFPLAIERM